MIRKLMIFGAGVLIGYVGCGYLKKKEPVESKDDVVGWTEHDMNVTPRHSYSSYYCVNSYKTKKVAEKELADLRLSASEDILSYGSVSEADIKRYFYNEDAIAPYDECYGWNDIEMIESHSKVANCRSGGYMIVLEFKNLNINKKEE